MPTRSRVIVGLSGGVDSSVAALLLQRRGYDVRALFMKNWEDDDEDGRCAAAQDLEDAKAVCERLEIPLHKVNFADRYRERVFSRFLADYQAGRTPNPDILCNQEIKFRAFLDYALELGAEWIATGHYARAQKNAGGYALLKGRDAGKDQSYFLYTLGQRQLARVLFPLGDLHKTEVRRLAAEAGLPNHAKKDSTGICFIGERNFRQFLGRYLSARPGDMYTPEGARVGTHDGVMFYTLGQRRGLGIGGRHDAGAAPWYVVGKEPERNVLLVAQGHDHPLLYHRALQATRLSWVGGAAPATPPYRCRAKTRYRQADQDCTLSAIDNDRCRVEFDQPQWAITPGQSVVFYQDETCLGGGVIDEVA